EIVHAPPAPELGELVAVDEVDGAVERLVHGALSRRPLAVPEAAAPDAGELVELREVLAALLRPLAGAVVVEGGVVLVPRVEHEHVAAVGALLDPVRRRARVAVPDELLVRHAAVPEARGDVLPVGLGELSGLLAVVRSNVISVIPRVNCLEVVNMPAPGSFTPDELDDAIERYLAGEGRLMAIAQSIGI